ncbi:MAG: ComF family protein, partial [Lentisphaerae bacterium]|nr:ComF family protein [Lentisphaerota bacterium]
MDVWRNLLDLVYPRNCVVCGRTVGRGGHTLCWNCLAEAFFIRPPLCAVCGNPAEGRIDKAYTCATCARRPPRFEAARSAVRFRTSLRKALHAFKYGHAT